MTKIIGHKGGKGGSGAAATRAAVEAPNTLQTKATVRVIDLISHGECVGLANRADITKSVFYEDVPIKDNAGNVNYNGVVLHERVGLPNQAPIPGFGEIESERVFNLEVTVVSSRIVAFTNNNVDACKVKIRFPSLTTQDKKTGDLNGANVQFHIDRRVANGGWGTVVTENITDKCTTAQELTYRIDKPAGIDDQTDWEIRVVRDTPDSTDVTVQNKTFLTSVTEITEVKLQYSGYALVAQQVDSEQFGERVPQRSFDFVGLVLDVPVNYVSPDWNDPLNQSHRVYQGLWDGTFKRAWTDNPAWILWAMLTDRDWGLGRVIQPGQVDKWSLYQIAKYCDEFVPDGFGGFEPRYRINTQVTNSAQAYALLQSIASAFRGMLYWGSGTVTFAADQPKDPIKLVTQANVIDGEFNYTGSSLKARHSVARVTWNDPSDAYKPAVEVVEDPDMIARFQWRPTDVIAYGCVTRGQAARMGRWILDTERYESEVVSYKASFDHADVRPGDIIQIHDPSYAGVRYGGRVVAITGTTATLDADLEIFAGEAYSITFVKPDGSLVTRNFTMGGTAHDVNLFSAINPLPASTSTVTIFSSATPVQRGLIKAISTVGVEFKFPMIVKTGYEYRIGFTLPDGSTVSRPIRNATMNSLGVLGNATDHEVRYFEFSQSLVTLPNIDTIAFLYVPSEGFYARGISSIGPTSCTLDSAIEILPEYTYEAEFVFPDGTKTTRLLTNQGYSSTNNITWAGALNDLPLVGSVWGVSATHILPREFRVLANREVEQNVYEITALNYDRNKYGRVELGLKFEDPSNSIFEARPYPDPPTNLDGYRRVVFLDGMWLEKIYVFWEPSRSRFVYKYKISYKKDDNAWKHLPDVTSPSAEFVSEGPGIYTFIIRAVNMLGKESTPLIDSLELLDERPFDSAIITNLRIEGEADGINTWTGSDLKLAWDVSPPQDWWTAVGTDWEDPYLKDYRVQVKRTDDSVVGVFYVRDRRFTLTRERNAELNGGFPIRTVKIGVALRDVNNRVHQETVEQFTNPPPAKPTTITLIPAARGFTIIIPKPPELDYSGTLVWVSTSVGFNPLVTPPLYNSQQLTYSVVGSPGVPHYVRVAHYDDFSTQPSDLNISDQFMVTPEGFTAGDIDSTPPAIPTGLVLTSEIRTNQDGSKYFVLIATWSANSESDMGLYDLELQEGNGTGSNWISYPTSNRRFEITVKPNVQYAAHVRAADKVGNFSGFSAIVTHTTARDTVPPAAPTSLSAIASLDSIFLSWTCPPDSDVDKIEIWENTTNAQPNPSTETNLRIAVVNAAPSVRGGFTRSGLTSGVTRYYWVRAVDTSGNVSPFNQSAAVSVTTLQLAAANFPNDLAPIPRVSALPNPTGYAGFRTVFLTSDNGLYNYDASVPQWKSVSSDFSGQITTTNITDGAVTTPKLAANSVTAAKIAAGEIQANHIGAGQIQASHISTETITASKMYIGDVDNSILDPNFRDPTYWSIFTSGVAANKMTFSTDLSASRANNWQQDTVMLLADNGATSYDVGMSGWLPTQPGQEYAFNARYGNLGDGTAPQIEFYIFFYTTSSQAINSYSSWSTHPDAVISGLTTANPTLSTTATPTDFVNLCRVPANCNYMRFGVRRVGGSGTATLIVSKPVIRRRHSSYLIVDGTVAARHIAANTITASQIAANTITGDRILSNTSLPGTIFVGTTGTSIQTMHTWANDPASRINNMATLIQPGLISVSGATTLTSWRNGSDTTKIEGGSIAANTITANKMRIGTRGVTTSGLDFQADPPNQRVSTSGGYILWENDAGTMVSTQVPAQVFPLGADLVIYIYWTKGAAALFSTSDWASASVGDNILMATYSGGGSVVAHYGGTIIDGGRITAHSMTADRMVTSTLDVQLGVGVGGKVFIDGLNGRIFIGD